MGEEFVHSFIHALDSLVNMNVEHYTGRDQWAWLLNSFIIFFFEIK